MISPLILSFTLGFLTCDDVRQEYQTASCCENSSNIVLLERVEIPPSPPMLYTCPGDSSGYYWTEHSKVLATMISYPGTVRDSGDEVCADDLTSLLATEFTLNALMGDEIPGYGRFPFITPCPADVATETFSLGTTTASLPNTPYTSQLTDASKYQASSVAGLAEFGITAAVAGFPTPDFWVCESHVEFTANLFSMEPSAILAFWLSGGLIKSERVITFPASSQLNIFGALIGVDAMGFTMAIANYTARTGIQVTYLGSSAFEAQAQTYLASLNVTSGLGMLTGMPQRIDVMLWPQPGAVTGAVDTYGNLMSLTSVGYNINDLISAYSQPMLDLAIVDGVAYGLPNAANLKSTIYYSPERFAAFNYTIPTTWDEFTQLMDVIISDREAAIASDPTISDYHFPMCEAVYSNGATGWRLTDWFEQLMVTFYPELYAGMYSTPSSYASPEYSDIISKMITYLTKHNAIFRTTDEDKRQFTTSDTIMSTYFGRGGDPLFTRHSSGSPGCFMLFGASFMEGFFDATPLQLAEINTFPFPKASSTSGNGIFGGGDFAGFVDNPMVRSNSQTRQALTELLFTDQETFWQSMYDSVPNSVRLPAKSGMTLNFPTAKLETTYNALSGAISNNLFRFDGSDLMSQPLLNDEWWRLMSLLGSNVPESTQPSLWKNLVLNRMESYFHEHEQTYDICLQYAGTGKGDFSFNDMASVGYESMKTLHPSYTYQDSSIVWGPPITDDNRQDKASRAIKNCNLTIGVGFNYASSYTNALPSDTTVAIIDTIVPGATSVTFAANEGSFLAGVVAALTSVTKKIGFISGVQFIPVITPFEVGFIAGVHYVDPSINVSVQYLSVAPDLSGFDNPDKAENVSLAMFDVGVDVIMHASGGSGTGLFKAAYERSNSSGLQKWAIGVDSDQYATVPIIYRPHILTSMMKRVNTAVETIIEHFIAGTPGSMIHLGLSENGVGVSKSGGFFSSHYSYIDTVTTMIVNGSIIVPSTY